MGEGGTAGHRWPPLATAGDICANFATCTCEPLTMLNPDFVAGEHGFLGPMSPKTFGLFISFESDLDILKLSVDI